MGLDLSVIPDMYDTLCSENEVLGRTYLPFERDYRLFDAIRELPSMEVNDNFILIFYNDEGLERHNTNPYGQKLTYTGAFSFHYIRLSYSQWNNGVLKFLQSLRHDTKIILWWH